MSAYCDRQYAEAQLQAATEARMRLEKYVCDVFGPDGIKILDRVREKAYLRYREEIQADTPDERGRLVKEFNEIDI